MAINMNTTRRSVLAGLGVMPVAAATPVLDVQPVAEDGRIARMVEVIEQLETVQGWQAFDIVCCKAFAAYRMRQALGLELPDPERASDHIHMTRRSFEAWQRTIWYERDLAAGKVATLSPWEGALA